MKGDSLIRRLRAARPATAEPVNHAALFARIVAEPGDPRLVEAPQSARPGSLVERCGRGHVHVRAFSRAARSGWLVSARRLCSP